MKQLMILFLMAVTLSLASCAEEVCYPCEVKFGPIGEVPLKDSIVLECIRSYGYNVAEQNIRDRMVADGFAAYVDCRK